MHVVKNQSAVKNLNPSSNGLKRNLRRSVEDNCRLSARDKGVHFRFFNGPNVLQVGNNTMTHDYYTLSDSESDMTWLGQPSPILLTSSPPQSAVKVPATKCVTTSFGTSASTGNDYTNGDGQQYYINSFQNESGHHEDNSLTEEYFNNYPEVFLQQEATNLFCDSLRTTATGSFPYAVDVSDNYFKYTTTGPESCGLRNGMIDHSSHQHHYPPINRIPIPPSTGSIFVGGPLFSTVEDDEDGVYNTNSHLVERRATKDCSVEGLKNKTTTHSSHTVRTNKRPLFESTKKTEQHNPGNISPRINIHNEQRHKGVDKGGCENEPLISVGKANYCGKPSKSYKLNNTIELNKATKGIGKIWKESSDKTPQRETYFAMNSLASNQLGRDRHREGNGNRELFKHGESYVRRQPVEDEDDDATTLSLATTSDDELELSSSSTSSTTCGSLSSSRYKGDVVPGISDRNSSRYGQDVHMKKNYPHDQNGVMIQKVAIVNNSHASGAPEDMQGRPKFLRSQSTRGKTVYFSLLFTSSIRRKYRIR